MEDTKHYDYTYPVAQLLTYGEAKMVGPQDWPNYLELGFNAEHIPDLIHMAVDKELNNVDPESLEVWAPLHAWRTLGQLRAEAAIGPMLALFTGEVEEDMSDWVMNELPEVYGMIGPAALPALTAFVADNSQGEWARIFAVESIEKVGEIFPDARSTSIEILSKQLEAFQKEEYDLNAALIEALVDLDAKEAAPLMEQVFVADAVDTFFMGDWEDIQEEMGLLSPEQLEGIHQRKKAQEIQAQQEFEERWQEREKENPFHVHLAATPSDTYWKPTPRTPVAKKAKHKDKVAKQSRKKNRKR